MSSFEKPDQPSHYQGLAVYRAATLLYVCTERVVKKFSRYHMYMLGDELRRHALQAPILVMRANRRATRAVAMEELCLGAETMKIMINLSKEVDAFASFSAYTELAKLVMELARQAEAWRRFSEQSRSGSPKSALQRGPE